VQKPVLSYLAKLICSGAAVGGVDAQERVNGVVVPQGGLPPAVDNLEDAVVAFPPDKGVWRHAAIMYLHRFVDELRH